MSPNMSGIPACLRNALAVSVYGARSVVVLLLLVARLANGDTLAPSRDRALFELHHWTAKDGAPGGITRPKRSSFAGISVLATRQE